MHLTLALGSAMLLQYWAIIENSSALPPAIAGARLLPDLRAYSSEWLGAVCG